MTLACRPLDDALQSGNREADLREVGDELLVALYLRLDGLQYLLSRRASIPYRHDVMTVAIEYRPDDSPFCQRGLATASGKGKSKQSAVDDGGLHLAQGLKVERRPRQVELVVALEVFLDERLQRLGATLPPLWILHLGYLADVPCRLVLLTLTLGVVQLPDPPPCLGVITALLPRVAKLLTGGHGS